MQMIYVLNKEYKASRKDIYYALIDLLDDIAIIDKQIYIEALRVYGDTKLDYVDCILVARHKLLNDDIYTLDKELKKVMQK